MSDPVEEIAPPPEPERQPQPPESSRAAPPRRIGRPVLIAAAAALIIVGALVASPFWAPELTSLLPWGAPESKPQPAPPPAPDPALAAAKVQAGQNAAALAQLGQRVAALEARPAPDLSTIQQQLAALNKTTADLTEKIAALDKAAQQQPAADPKNTALALVLLQIRDAVDIGRPFEAEYQALLVLSRDHPDIAAAAAPLAEAAESGVASRAVLTERLRQLAPQIATARPPPKNTLKSQIVARLRSLVTIRRIDGDRQTPAEAAVSAAQHALAGGDLAGAIAALAGLSGPNQAAAQPWLKMAKERLAVEAALRQVQAALTASLGNAAPAVPSKGG